MPQIHDVILYSNLSYSEVLELPIDVFMLMRKKYYIGRLMETSEGREYLAKCERLQTTKADRTGISNIRKKLERGQTNGA